MFTFIHAADLHLDSPLRGLERYPGAAVEEVRGATRRALENLVSLAMDRAVQFIIIAGDIYDGDWKDHNTGLFFADQMNRLRAVGIPVILIAGNHDAQNRMTRSLQLPDNVEMLSAHQATSAVHPKLEDWGVAIHGRSFARQAEVENMVPEYPRRRSGMFNIGILHTALDGAEGHDRYAPCSLRDLQQKDYDYWALGHVHHRQVVCTDPPIVFSGNIQGRHIREFGAKGCYVVSVHGTDSVELQFEPLDVMRWETCNLDATLVQRSEDLLILFQEELARQVQRHGELPLAVRVVVSGSSACHQSLLADAEHWSNQFRAVALQSSAPVWVEKVKLETSFARPMTVEAVGDGPIGELLQVYHELRSDEGLLKELKVEWQELQRKLPDELLHGLESLHTNDAEQVRRWLDEALSIVTSRLGVSSQP